MWNSKNHTNSCTGTRNFQNNRKTIGMTSTNSVAKPTPRKTFGMTSAISLETGDLQKNDELMKALESYNIFEKKSELNHRMDIMVKLDNLFKQWIRDVSIAKNMSEAMARKLGGKVYTFGSYRLGVHDPKADIDALCVAPRNIERADYFGSFFQLLKKQPEVTECRAVEEAFVPVIKLNFGGIDIDLLFARLQLKEIPENLDLQNDMLLKNLDPASVRSLNGCRVTDEILRLVPNVDNFRLALRAIKLWAKNKGIYSNSLGFLGGVSWAMLIARVCQLYPNAAPATLVHKFFLVYTIWEWPRPILLKQPVDVNIGFQVWDPRVNYADRLHLMPIITPAYPHQNSTFNVSNSTRKVMVDEFKQGRQIMDDIMLNNADWNKLFEAPNFFSKYKHFIVLLASSKNANDQLEWCGLVESKIRTLIQKLEQNPHISMAHINPKCFEQKDAQLCSKWFIGLEFEKTENLNIDLTDSIQSFIDTVNKQAAKCFHRDVQDDMKINAQYIRRKQLSQYLDDPNLLKRKRKNSDSGLATTLPTDGTAPTRKRRSPEMGETAITAISKKSKYDS